MLERRQLYSLLFAGARKPAPQASLLAPDKQAAENAHDRQVIAVQAWQLAFDGIEGRLKKEMTPAQYTELRAVHQRHWNEIVVEYGQPGLEALAGFFPRKPQYDELIKRTADDWLAEHSRMR